MKPHFSLSNAAGWAKTVEHVRQLAEVPYLTEIVVGSFTVEPREGNLGGTNFATLPDGTGVNSLGMPNGGIPYLERHLPEMVVIAHSAGKKLIVNIGGFNPAEFRTLAEVATGYDVDGIEVNLGCPNIWDDGAQKPIFAWDTKTLRTALANVILVCRRHTSIRAKLSTYDHDAELRKQVASTIQEFDGSLHAVVCCNTKPKFKPLDDSGKPILGVTDGFGGMSGEGLYTIAHEEATVFRKLLPDSIAVIGAGGINSGSRILERLELGCEGVQIGTAFFWNENFRAFQGFMEELVALDDAEQWFSDLSEDTSAA